MNFKKLALTACVSLACSGAVFAYNNTTQNEQIAKTKNDSNFGGVGFPYYVRNDSDLTVTNIWVQHGSANNRDAYNIPVLKPGEQAGPFNAYWNYSYNDYWSLSLALPSSPHPDYRINMYGKQCNIESSDLYNNPNWVVVRIKKEYINMITKTHQMFVRISPPVTSGCDGYGESAPWP